MENTAQESSRCKDRSGCGEDITIFEEDATNSAVADDQAFGMAANNGNPLFRCNHGLDSSGEMATVRLDARSMDCRSLATVEHAIVNCSPVGCFRDQSVEHVHLANEMPLAYSADCGIAGHGADTRWIIGDQRNTRALPRGSSSRLASGMSATDNDNVELEHDAAMLSLPAKFNVPRGTSLADTEAPEQAVEHILYAAAADHRIQRLRRLHQMFRNQHMVPDLLRRSKMISNRGCHGPLTQS